MAEAEPQAQNLNNLDQTPIVPRSTSIDDFSGDASSSAAITGEEELDFLSRPSKRRKSCPFALERLKELTPDSNRLFSFTFDTNSGGSAPEITPKFGSFNLTKWEQEGQKLGVEIREEETEKAAKEDQEVKKEAIAEADGVCERG